MRDPQRLARAARLALAVLLALATVPIGPAPPAHAHAGLVSSVPAQGSVIGHSPTEAVLTFSEPVRPVTSRIQVIAPDGKRINDGEPTAVGRTLTIPLRVADRPLGTYLVSYRVISADSHPVSGAVTFSVGAPSASAPRAAEEAGVHPVVRVAVPAAKFVGYAGLALAVGAALVLALLWPRRTPRVAATRLVRGGLAALAAATAASLWLQAPYASGAGPLDVSPTELGQVLATPAGMALAARLGLLAAAATLLRPVLRGRVRAGRWRGWTLAALAVGGAATWPLSGHALAAPAPPVAVLADTVHVLAMALWLGGLVALVPLLRRAHHRVLARVLPAWARWAALAVCWLALAGVVQALPEVGSLAALTGTAYGRLLLAKAGLLALVLAVAALARRGVRRGAPGLVRRAVRVELAGAALVLAASAVLVQTTPARVAVVEAREAALDGVAQTLESSLYTLQFEIYPVQLGENNTVHAYAYTPQGRPQPVVEWRLSAALPERELGPTVTPLLGLEPHHGMGAVTFPVPGEWELRFTLRVSEIDQATVTTRVRVR